MLTTKKMKVIGLLICIFSALAIGAEENKIIFLLSTPRSLSTVFVRMMLNRGDFSTYSEPAMAMYFKKHHPEVNFKFNANALYSFSQMEEEFESNRLKKHLFIKEFGSRLWPLFEENPHYFDDPKCHFVFLIRPPNKVAVSLYRGLKKMSSAKIDELSLADLVMHEELWIIYKKIREKAKNPPILIFSDQLSDNPSETVQNFCHKTGIEFSQNHLIWKALNMAKEEIPNWHETKQYSDIRIWNEDVFKSTGFVLQKNYEVNAMGEPTFKEIEDIEDREAVKKAYLRQLPFYELFLSEANK